MVDQQQGWIEWAGGDQPVPDRARVECRFGEIEPQTAFGLAGQYFWGDHIRAKNLDAHITAYRIVDSGK